MDVHLSGFEKGPSILRAVYSSQISNKRDEAAGNNGYCIVTSDLIRKIGEQKIIENNVKVSCWPVPHVM